MKAPSSPSSSHAHIIVVDDSGAASTARKAVLEESGYTVSVAANMTQARALLSSLSTAPTVVVANHHPPKIDGLTLLRETQASHLHLPFVLISSAVDAADLDAADTGAAVVAKGANEVTHLLRAVKRLTTRRTRRKPPSSAPGVGPATRKQSF